MKVQTVFFDMGGTIETFWHTPELRLQATPGLRRKMEDAGLFLKMDDQHLCAEVSSGWHEYHRWAIDTRVELPPVKIWSEFILANHKLFSNLSNSCAEDLLVYLEINYFHRELRPEIPMVLEAIKELGLKIGLISNVGSLGLVPQQLRKYGIIHYFNPIVLSSEFSRRKPDPAIFHHAARLISTPTSKCLYVGDRIARDIVGARKAGYGMAVQIINQFDHGENDTGAIPDAVISSMDELIGILESHISKNDLVDTHDREIDGVRAILFDAGDILYFRPRSGERLTKFLVKHGLSDRNLSTEKKKELKEQSFHGVISQDEFREITLRLLGVESEDKLTEGKQAMLEDDNDVQFIEGVKDTLIFLKEHGFMLGIITDTANPLHMKLEWFEKGGFGHVWDSIISSQDVGAQKPAREIYLAALHQLGIHPDQALFVGHDPTELEGAQRVGLKTVAFNYSEDVKADYFIDEFSDLLSISILEQEITVGN